MKSNKFANYFKNMNLNFCKAAKIYLTVVAALFIAAIIIVSIIGFKGGFDFSGGTIIEVVYGVEFDENGNAYENGSPYDKETAISYLDEVLGDYGVLQLASIQTANGEFGDVIVYKLISETPLKDNKLAQLKTNLFEKFSEYDPEGLLQKDYISVYNIQETKLDVAKYSSIALSVALVLFAIGAIFRFGLSAAISIFVSTLINVMLVFATVIICRITVNVPFIASVLTVFALSIISNLIYFDYIRKNKINKELSREEIANLTAKQVSPVIMLILAISLIAIILLTGFGVLPIREFALPVMVCLFFVALTTLFALPLLWNKIDFNKKRKRSGK